MTRITGLATGLDVDSVVQETMQAYQTKIDTVDQQKKLVELQQEMYREVITECRDFYDKYFDMTKSDSLLLQKNWVSNSFESSNVSVATVTGGPKAQLDNYSINVKKLAQPAKEKITEAEFDNLKNLKISVDGKDVEVDFTNIDTKDKSESQIRTEKIKAINEALTKCGITTITAKYSEFSGGITISSNTTGQSQKFDISYISNSGATTTKNVVGQNAQVEITNGAGETHVYKGESNTVSLDGVNFKFSSVGTTQVTGKSDAKDIKDKLVKFVNDYNTLMEKLNTLINEKRDSDYMPLTDAQKEDMTEKQIELWEKKVKTGQLSKDNDLTRIRNAMKTAMSTLVSSSESSLKAIGITPLADYNGNKNGTYTIDEDKLSSALENNIEDVMKVFISTGDTDSEKGVLQRLKSIFDKETQTSSALLLKKAGMEGSATSSNNTLSKKIAKYEEKITRMQTIFASKQQALYSKYARLETLMNNLNSQSSSLTSMFSS